MRNIFIMLLCVCASNIFAQETQYKSVLNNGMARWSYLYGGTTIYGSYDVFVNHPMINNNDTLINGLLYKKIYIDGYANAFENNTEWQNYMLNVYSNFDTSNFIRESEDASKLYVFYTYLSVAEEILIYDLNLEVGDPYVLTIYSGTYKFPEDTIYVDSVYIKDGLKHIQLDYFVYFFEYSEKLTFIEGVGPNVGISEIGCSPRHMVNCFQNDIHFYKNEHFHEFPCGCDGFGDKVENIDYENCKIWTESGNLIISCEKFQNVQIIINNVYGQCCLSKSFSEAQNISIFITNFPKGIYILKILDKNTNQQYTTKIIL